MSSDLGFSVSGFMPGLNDEAEEACWILDWEHHHRAMEVAMASSSMSRSHPHVHGLSPFSEVGSGRREPILSLSLTTTKWIDYLAHCIRCQFPLRQSHQNLIAIASGPRQQKLEILKV
jgi:hypothetical protein